MGNTPSRSGRRTSSSSRSGSRSSMNVNTRKRYVKKKRRGNGPRIALYAIILVAAVGLVGFGAYYLSSGGGTASASSADKLVILDNGTIPMGTTIDGISVGGMNIEQAREALSGLSAEKSDQYSVTLSIPGSDQDDEVLTGEQLGIRPDVDGAIEDAMNVYRSGASMKDRQTAIETVASTGNALTTDYTYDAAMVKSALASSELISAEANEPQASFNKDTAEFTFTEGKDGLEVDMDKLAELVVAEIESGQFGIVEVPGERKASTKTVDELRANTKIRASAETKFNQKASSSAPNRVYNIQKIASKLNGAKIMPGQEFSVNEHVGPRTDPNEWKAAPGIADGDYTEQLGGGICQVSTTLYIALMKADLKITARQNHSIPIGYVQKGMDATISTGGPDLRFANNTDYPLYLYVGVNTSSKTVVCRVYGQPLEEGLSIDFRIVTESELPMPSPSIVTDPEKVRAGGDGAVVRVYKQYMKGGKMIKEVEAHKSTYKARAPFILDPAISPPEPDLTPEPSISASPTEVVPDNNTDNPDNKPTNPTPTQAQPTQAPTPAPTQAQTAPPVVSEAPKPVDTGNSNPDPNPDPGGLDGVVTLTEE